MLHAVNTQHGLQRIGPSAIARLGIKRLDDSGHILPWQNLLHAGEENLFSGLTALSAEFTIGEGELMAHDVPLGCAPDEYDEWGNLLNEENPHQLQQLIRLPGQQYDEESGLYYNRHRYYDPLQGRYITQDPIGLKGGWNFYQYPLNPISNIDPLGLETLKCIKPLHSMGGTGERSGPDIWGNPFYHQYLCVPDGKGDYTCGGQDQRGESKGDGLWGPGKASNDTKEAAGRCDLVETDNSCVENCLKGKFKEVRPRYSVLPDIFTPINLGLFKNCQDWSNDSLETCKMKCSGNNIGRFIRFVFTGVM